jgi:stage II sporulation protein D
LSGQPHLKGILAAVGLLLLLLSGCVPPEKGARPGVIRVAVLEGTRSLTLSSNSVMTVKDTRSGKLVSRSRGGQSITVKLSSDRMDVAGRTFATGDLTATSSSNQISVNGKAYPGSLRVLRQGSGLLAVNLVDLDAYLKAVVPSEMLPSWPEEALKAQAVVSRSFVLYHALENRDKDFDITSNKQVYNPDKQDPRTDKAVDATKNVVLFYRGKLLLPFFCTCCGGFTEYAANVWETDEEFPRPVECPYCRDAPDYHWRARMTLAELREKLRSAGVSSARSIAIHRRSTAGGRITALRIQSDDGETIIKINRFRLLLGPNLIRSGLFEIEVKNGYVTFEGRGWGHGVGMCQRGAKVLAERGKSFKSILRTYFPGVQLRKMSW